MLGNVQRIFFPRSAWNCSMVLIIGSVSNQFSEPYKQKFPSHVRSWYIIILPGQYIRCSMSVLLTALRMCGSERRGFALQCFSFSHKSVLLGHAMCLFTKRTFVLFT